MEGFREFMGKDVDEAISKACTYFQVSREELEIEIISGGSSGIFGLVGLKKAKIKAKKRSAYSLEPTQNQPQKTQEVKKSIEKTKQPDLKPSIDAEAEEKIKGIIQKLIAPISNEPEIRVNLSSEPVYVQIIDEANAGLIIGKEGQTIEALQYLVNRIIAKKHPELPKVQLDAGNYRQKQNEQLKKTALFLAQKAKKLQKNLKTQPLSAYHRRLVHLALQKDQQIQTKSLGDGPLKRVLIIPKRNQNKTK